MEVIGNIIGTLNSFLWGWPLVILLVCLHVYMTVRLKFIQVHLLKGIRLTFARDADSPGDVSHFASFCVAMAATVGTGNIIGVATAISLGGPGAVFWMWIIGVFGIATKYAESLLAVKYRVRREDGAMAGGPMYVLERGLGQRWLGVLFAIFTALAAFGIGCMVQSNAVAATLNAAFNIPVAASGFAMTVLIAIVSVAGLRSIAVVCSWLVPIMSVFYVLVCFVILIMTLNLVPGTIALIVTSAFSGHAATAGFIGVTIKEAIRYGAARGLFSNEAGMGSAPIAAAAAQTKNCVRQALVSSTAVFWDTVIICALTGIVIINSGAWTQGLGGGALVNAAFNELLPETVAGVFVAVSICTFAVSTTLGWLYYSEKAVEYLVGRIGMYPYRLLFTVALFLGAVIKLEVVWDFADLVNGLMVLPNLVALVLLSKVVADESDRFLKHGGIDEDSGEPVPDYAPAGKKSAPAPGRKKAF